MPARRQIFGTHYGTAKMEQGRGKGNIPPAQTQPPVPLSLAQDQGQDQRQGQGQSFGTRIGPSQMPGTPAQGASQPAGEANAAGAAPFPPEMEQLLQRLLAQFGGANG